MIKDKFIGLVVLFVIIASCRPTPTKENIYSPPETDTIKLIFFLDGKQVSRNQVIERELGGGVEYINWSNGTRDALVRFGEKYHNGIRILRTRNEK